MAEQQQEQTVKLNGYLTANQLLTEAINQSITVGVTLDEVLAALKIQVEVISLRFNQVMVENGQRQAIEAYKAQMAAEAGQQDLPLDSKEE